MMLKLAAMTVVIASLLCAFADAPADAQTVPVAPTGNGPIDKFNEDNILLTRALMTPKNVADAFGRRIARRYIAVQLTIANRNPDFQWLVTDAAIDLTRLLHYMSGGPTPAGTVPPAATPSTVVTPPTGVTGRPACAARVTSLLSLFAKPPNPTISGADLTVLRGVAEKGQLLDPRNFTLRVMQGSGTIAAGLLGITSFGPAFAPSIAAFNGPAISAFQRIFPDETVNQMNRLNDSAYGANMLVPKQQARVAVVFMPAATLLTHEEEDRFYKDPNSIYSECVDLRLLDASVNGHPIVQLDLTPLIVSVDISAAEAAKFGSDNFKVAGGLIGRNLDGAILELSGAPVGLSIKTTGTPSSDQIRFELSSGKPLAPNTAIAFVLRKTGSPNRTWTTTAAWAASRPTIVSSGITPASLKQGEQKTIEINGTGFLPGSMLEFDNRTGLTVGDVVYVSTSKAKSRSVGSSDSDHGSARNLGSYGRR